MFAVSRLAWLLLDPLHVVVLLLLGALAARAARRERLSRNLARTSAALFLVLALVPGGSWVLGVLEARFPAMQLPGRVDGIVVLGGAINPSMSQARGQTSLNEAAERVTAAVALIRRHPDARVVFAGGNGSLARNAPTEASEAKRFFRDLGVDVDRVIFEDTSRNTYENAVNARMLAAPTPEQTWLLVTSAAHMPRAIGAFRAAGFGNVVAWPVDHLTDGRFVVVSSNAHTNLLHWSVAARELLGLVAYRVTGRSDALLPGP